MLVPISRTSGAMACNLIRSALPSVTPLASHLLNFWRPERLSPTPGSEPSPNPSSSIQTDIGHTTSTFSSSSSASAPKVFALFGMRNTDRVVGSRTLHYVMNRHIGSTSVKPAETSPQFKPMIEPYGSLIKSVQSDFLKIGFFKIHEDEHSVTFFNGTQKVAIATDRYDQPSMTGLFVNKNGNSHAIWMLQDRLDSPDDANKDFLEKNAIIKKYRMNDDDTPGAVKEEGLRAMLSLRLTRMITFLDTHKKALAELK